MRQIREFRTYFENISRDCRECLTTFPRMQLIFILIRTTVARYLCECRTTFVRMSLSFIFSPGNREVFACFLKTVARPSCDTRTTFKRVSRKFRIVNSPKFRGDRFATLARTSRDRRTTVARQSCEIFLAKKCAFFIF